MKDLLVVCVEYLFDIDKDEEITFKLILKVIIKISIFILIVFLGIWLLQKIKHL
jgi:hypothetical protein